MTHCQLHLASASPRRREILESLGLHFTFAGVDVDETPFPAEGAKDMALRLATAKAQAAFGGDYTSRVVLAADTVVSLDDSVFGKPESKESALSMLATLSGRCHTVVTAVVVSCCNEISNVVSETQVRFREISPDEADQYWQSGEPCDKAGAYAIQGLGGVFVESLSGSYSGVVGLPVFETAGMLRKAGIEVLAPSGK